MFNKKLEKDIQKLKEEVFGNERDKLEWEGIGAIWFNPLEKKALRKEIERLEKYVVEELDLIKKYLGIRVAQITESKKIIKIKKHG